MKISVVMTTYNGEKYIIEQLRSIYDQTRKPDEVIICDDCSTDSTVAIIKDYIQAHALENWSVQINKKNKGWQCNFIDAIAQATGDIIFLSDQDDVWNTDKIEKMSGIMEENRKIQCLTGKMVRIDAEGNRIEDSAAEGNYTGTVREIPFSKKFNSVVLLGCVMCITKQVAEIIHQIGVKDFGHDAQCCRLGILLDGTYVFDYPVIQYRMHGGNTSGVIAGSSYGASNLDKRIDAIRANIGWLKAVLACNEKSSFLNMEKINIIQKTIAMQDVRLEFLSKRKLLDYIKLLKYYKYYSGMTMYLGDWAYAFGINKSAGNVLKKVQK